MTGHNLPRSVFPYPDIRESPFVAGRFIVFVLAFEMISTRRYRKIIIVHPYLEAGNGHTGLRVNIILK